MKQAPNLFSVSGLFTSHSHFGQRTPYPSELGKTPTTHGRPSCVARLPSASTATTGLIPAAEPAASSAATGLASAGETAATTTELARQGICNGNGQVLAMF